MVSDLSLFCASVGACTSDELGYFNVRPWSVTEAEHCVHVRTDSEAFSCNLDPVVYAFNFDCFLVVWTYEMEWVVFFLVTTGTPSVVLWTPGMFHFVLSGVSIVVLVCLVGK